WSRRGHQQRAVEGRTKTHDKSHPMQHLLNPRLAEELRRVPVVPVLTIDDAKLAVPLAQALMAGGLRILEMTLRTEAALEGISRVGQERAGVRDEAGTGSTTAHAHRMIAAGVRFLVSAGRTARLVQPADGWSVTFLPGAATPSDAMVLADLG